MGLDDFDLSGRVYFDACAIIYIVEKHPKFADPLQLILDKIDSSGGRLCTSALSWLEVTVKPIRDGNKRLEADFQQFLAAAEINPVTKPVLLQAARFRANARSMKTPDAIHLAIAAGFGCDLFVTSDKRLASRILIPALLLSEVKP
ncbi:MAG: type II toxin-antitoxin system VapC family toxin [Planctomycetota bacterium]